VLRRVPRRRVQLFQFLMDKAVIFLHHRRSQTDQERNQ
jgi:hypothetical protein